ncbi:MAG: protein kinase domain-containing protein [Chlamydiia bacterium]
MSLQVVPAPVLHDIEPLLPAKLTSIFTVLVDRIKKLFAWIASLFFGGYLTPFSDREKRELRDLGITLFEDYNSKKPLPLVNLEESTIQITTKTGEPREKRCLVASAPYVAGGESEVRIGMMRGKRGNVKKVTFISPKLRQEETQLERKILSGPKKDRIGPKTYFLSDGSAISLFASNGTVDHYLRKNPSANKRKIVAGELKQLSALWSKGLVHRDIKGNNFVITGQGEVQLIDFGMTRSLQDAENFCSEDTTVYCVPFGCENSKKNYDVNPYHIDFHALGNHILNMYAPVYQIARDCKNDAQKFNKHLKTHKLPLLAKIEDPLLREFAEKLMYKYHEIDSEYISAMQAQLEGNLY